jgi:hypothetical protein
VNAQPHLTLPFWVELWWTLILTARHSSSRTPNRFVAALFFEAMFVLLIDVTAVNMHASKQVKLHASATVVITSNSARGSTIVREAPNPAKLGLFEGPHGILALDTALVD